MRKVKGSMIKIFVKAVRADKSGVYDKYLTDKDKEIISEKIFDSAWYPFETYKNCFNAVATVFARGNLEIIKKWGVDVGKDLMEKIYMPSLARKDLKSSLQLYNRLFKLWFNFGRQSIEFLSDNEVNLTYEDFDTEFEYFYHTARGWLESALKLLIGKKIDTKFLAKSWEGDKATVINITV